ncbi:MAG: hypothetical protein LUQ07_07150 [Methanospirillum sp.]|nr:hypothetical protein [Methanospirillum sp.]
MKSPMNPAVCLVFILTFLVVLIPVQATQYQDNPEDLSSPGPDSQAYPLKVALYPYITDVNHDNNAYLLSIMKHQFQNKNPSINLTVMMDPAYDCYNLTNLPGIFSEDGPQLVEADLSLLGYLVDNGYVRQIPDQSLERNIRSQAIPAGRYRYMTYAIPTWICSQFLFSRDKSISHVHSVSELFDLFRKHSSEYSQMLSSDFQGGSYWMLPMLYVFAYADNAGYTRMKEALYGLVNQSSVNTMTQTMDWCSVGETNNCLNGYYYNHSPTLVFARNKTYSYNGFSENLYNIRRTDPNSTLYVTPTPYGNNQNPLIWADGLVINKKACDDQCVEAASRFISYYNSIEVKTLIAFSKDAYSPAPPRYVLPSTQDFYRSEPVQRDRYYQAFEKGIDTAESFPNTGIVANISPRYQDICTRVKKNIPDTYCFCGSEDPGLQVE